MHKTLLAITLFVALTQAEDIVHYDKKKTEKAEMDKPNHPNNDLYGKSSR